MPVTWSISHDDRIVLVTAEGAVAFENIDDYLVAMAAAGAMPYRKLFDITYLAPDALRFADLKAIGKKVIAFATESAVGPIAIVVGSELLHEMAALFGEADVARPLAIFSERLKAREWLDGLAVGK